MSHNYSDYRYKDGRWKRHQDSRDLIVQCFAGIYIAVCIWLIFTHAVHAVVDRVHAQEVSATTSTSPVIIEVASELPCRKVGGSYKCSTPEMEARAAEVKKWYPEGTYHSPDKPTIKGVRKLSSEQIDVARKIVAIAKEEGYQNVNYLLSLADCESSFVPSNRNAKNNKPKHSIDRGLYMFNSYWQKSVSDKCAFDLECSTKKTIEYLKAGRQSLWVCDSIIKEYSDKYKYSF